MLDFYLNAPSHAQKELARRFKQSEEKKRLKRLQDKAFSLVDVTD
jgi:hypothetical protein